MKKRNLALGALVIMTALALTGCKNKAPEGYFTLESITEGDVTVKEKNLDEYGLEDSYVVFDEDGEGYLVVMNTPTDFSYNEKKSQLETSHGKIALKNDKKTITLADGEISMTFKKSKDDAPDKPAGGSFAASAGSDDLSESDDGSSPGLKDLLNSDAPVSTEAGSDPVTDYWNADWYGWWEIDGFMNEFDQFEGMKFPVLGKTELDQSGNGTLHLWDNDGDVINVVCSNNGSGLTEAGTMVVESGTIITNEAKHADFTIDPGTGAPEPHDGYIYFNGRVEDENGKTLYNYDFYLMKWGLEWNEIESDMRPDNYNWYLEQIGEGKSLPPNFPE